MIREDLVAERAANASYNYVIRWLGDDPATTIPTTAMNQRQRRIGRLLESGTKDSLTLVARGGRCTTVAGPAATSRAGSAATWTARGSARRPCRDIGDNGI